MATMTIRCSEDDKRAAAEVAEYYGFDLSSVTRAFWKQIGRTGRIPLDLGNDRQPESVEPVAPKPDRTEIIRAINTACTQFPAIKKATLFGSVARGTFNDESDVDIRLELDRSQRFNLRDLSHLAKQIEQATGRDADIITSNAIENEQIEKAIVKDGVLTYERQEQ